MILLLQIRNEKCKNETLQTNFAVEIIKFNFFEKNPHTVCYSTLLLVHMKQDVPVHFENPNVIVSYRLTTNYKFLISTYFHKAMS